MPFVGKIVDIPFLNILIRGSFYNLAADGRGEAGLLGKIIAIIFAIIAGAFMLLWFYGTPMIPVLLMGVLMHNPKIFYPLNNKVLEGVIGVVAIVSAYIWAAMLVGESCGFSSFLSLLWLLVPQLLCLLHYSHLRHVQDASNVVTLKQ